MRRAPSPARLPPAAAVLGKTVKKRAVSTAAEPGACCDGRLYGHGGRQNMPPTRRPTAIKGLARLCVAAQP
jgi:hypothetical protein